MFLYSYHIAEVNFLIEEKHMGTISIRDLFMCVYTHAHKHIIN